MNTKSLWSIFTRKVKGELLKFPSTYDEELAFKMKPVSYVYKAHPFDTRDITGKLEPVFKTPYLAAISIVIIAYNEEEYLSALLASLEVQTFKDFEIIIVDRNSKDRTVKAYDQFYKQFKEIRLIRLGCTKGPAYARNQGAQYAKYNRLLFLDADTLLKKDFLQNVIEKLLRCRTDVATCKIRIAENKFTSNLGAYFLNVFMVALKPVYPTAFGACLISTKTIHNKIGGFYEDLAICEDCNYIKRAISLNAKFRVLKLFFYTSDRRANKDINLVLLFKFLKIHLIRFVLRKEII